MPAAFDFVEDTTAKSFDFQADPIPTPEPAPTISPTAQLAKARLAFAPLAGQAVANLPDKPLITLPEWPKGEGSLEEQITGQVYGKLKDFLGFMTSPKGVAVTGAAIAAPEVAGPIISAAMLPAAVEEGIGTVKSIGKGDIPGAAGHATGLALTGAGVLGGVAQFLPRTVAEARVPAKLEKGPAPGTQRTRTGTVTIERSDIPTPSRVPTKEAIPIQLETPFTPLTPQEESAIKAQAEPEPLLQADVDRLFLDKLNEESNREIEAATAQPKPTPEIPEVRKIALEQQKAAGWNPDWPFVPADLMNKSFRDAIRSDPTLGAEEKAKILSFGPKDEPTPPPLTPAEQAEARADLAAELGEEPQAPVSPKPAPAPEAPPAISAPEAKATEIARGLHFVKSKADLDAILESGFKPGAGMGNFVSFYHEGQRPSDFGIGRKQAVVIEFDKSKGGSPKYEGGIEAQNIKSVREATPEEIAQWGKPRVPGVPPKGTTEPVLVRENAAVIEPTPRAKVEAPAAKEPETPVERMKVGLGMKSAGSPQVDALNSIYNLSGVYDKTERTWNYPSREEVLSRIEKAKSVGIRVEHQAPSQPGFAETWRIFDDEGNQALFQRDPNGRTTWHGFNKEPVFKPAAKLAAETEKETIPSEPATIPIPVRGAATARRAKTQSVAALEKRMEDLRYSRDAQVKGSARWEKLDKQYQTAYQKWKDAQPKPPETPPTGPGMATQPASPEARLSQSLQSVPKQKPPPQGPAAQPMGITPFPGLVTGLQKVAQSAQRVWHEIADVPKFAPFKRVINKFNGDTQRTSLKIRQMQADIESRVPDPKRLEAITNWLQADGDVAKLRAWESASRNANRRQGYRDAQRLTPYEVQVAKAIRQYYDDLLARGQAYGILDQAKDDYVTQIWKRPLLGGAQFAQFASKLSRTFKFGMKSVFENFFEGEQAGYKPVTKNISKLLGVYVSELEKTIATRDMIRDLTHETASDGNPLAKVEGTAHIAQDKAGDPTGPMFVRPGVVKGDVRYAELNHPALKNWKWISKDPESGRDVFILGELRVHPEIRRHLANVLSQSQIRKWMREPSESELANIVKLAARFGDTTSKVVKQTMLGTLSTFHHVQEGTHGLGHRANAFLPPKLPVGTPELNYALDHGLQLAGEGAALENFREGLGSHGVFDKVPVIGKWIEKHNDLLFNEYIPRLKWDTWQRINRRNMARYQKEIASGEVTADDVAYLSSKQTNAAFGHQNYTDLGRNATVQHVLRLFALAPDFLEARTRFAGQAAQGVLSKVGREQLEALSLLGGLFYVGARIGNKLSDDDYHWEEPFRVKYGNRWYGMRSVPEDLWRAFNDTRVFAYNRLNPVFGRPTMELLSGVNYRGEKIPASEVFKNILVSGIPIQMREFPAFRSLTETQRNTTIGAWEQFLSSVGVQVSRYSPLNQTYKLATKWRKAQGEKEAPTTYPVSKYQPLRYALEDHDLTRAADELAKLTEGGKVPLTKIAQGFRISLHRPFSGSLANEGKFVASLTPDQKALYKEAITQRSRVWREFTNAEQEYHNRMKEGR